LIWIGLHRDHVETLREIKLSVVTYVHPDVDDEIALHVSV